MDDADDALYQPPRGVDYHYAPLGFVGLSDGAPRVENSCQCLVYPPSTCGLLGRAQLNDDGSRPNHLAVATVAKPAVAKPATGKASVVKKAVSKTTTKRTTPKP